jgi:predicted enzyme related to lactoylglutathione lyase
MELRLIVVRTADTKRLSDFYSLLGLRFEYHQHGKSPFHYSTTIGKAVLEIYPLTKQQTEADKSLRLGFAVEFFEEKIKTLKEIQVVFSSEPMQTEFGFMAVIIDPDGRKIELYEDD